MSYWTTTPLGLHVPARVEVERQAATPAPCAVDLFCGCGGFSLGLEAAGIDVVGAVEWWAPAAVTYLLNLGHLDGCAVSYPNEADRDRLFKYFDQCKRDRAKRSKRSASDLSVNSFDVDPGEPGWIGIGRKRRLMYSDEEFYKTASGCPDPSWGPEPGKMQWGTNPDHGCRGFVFGDIREISGDFIRETLALKGWTRPIDIVCGGPPCQGFSKASGRQDPGDARNNLVLEYLRVAAELGVKTFLMENVPELYTTTTFRPLFDEFVRRANDAGYDVTAAVVDASNYGVPQYRRRVIVVGTQEGLPRFQFPIPTHYGFGSRADGTTWDYDKHGEGEADDPAPTPQQELF